jgi:hypothetical protein
VGPATSTRCMPFRISLGSELDTACVFRVALDLHCVEWGIGGTGHWVKSM